MRVVSGRLGGRRLVAPAGNATRPTSDRVREAVFNSLESMGALADATVLDLFSGSGALAIEAISRGAGHATCVEQDPVARDALRRNVSVCSLLDEVTIVRTSVDRFLETENGHFDLCFADPPYAFDAWDDLLGRLSCATLVIESDREIEPPGSWQVLRQRRYGSTVVTIATLTAASSDAEVEEMNR